MKNVLKTGILLGALTGLLVLIGQFFGGNQGMIIAFVFALIMNFGSYWFSDRIVLAMYRAKEVTEEEAPQLHRIVRQLTLKARLPMPKIYIVPSPAPNAFATGRDPQHAVVAVTQGILNLLNEEELEGVISHELSHIKNRDTLISAVAATLAGVIIMIANIARWAALFGGGGDQREDGGILGFIVLAVLAPIAATLIQLAISRSREYQADESAARITGNSIGLVGALEKLEATASRIPLKNAGTTTAHLFIVNPLKRGALTGLFSTHPPVAERIKRLEQLKV